ncbi:hypothetical protein FRAHR75_90055 [Frankia sp. Hr75.2]|nr:hypothetical protein FRAHR75_90055 [Frankia sp. Hr75.2]
MAVRLSEAQADGTACLCCAADLSTVASVPVGVSHTGTQTFACEGTCADAALGRASVVPPVRPAGRIFTAHIWLTLAGIVMVALYRSRVATVREDRTVDYTEQGVEGVWQIRTYGTVTVVALAPDVDAELTAAVLSLVPPGRELPQGSWPELADWAPDGWSVQVHQTDA